MTNIDALRFAAEGLRRKTPDSLLARDILAVLDEHALLRKALTDARAELMATMTVEQRIDDALEVIDEALKATGGTA